MPAYFLQSNGLRPVISTVVAEGFTVLHGPLEAENFAAAKAAFFKVAGKHFPEQVKAASPMAEAPVDPIFRSMHEALTFAYRFAHDQFPRTPMTLLMRDGKMGSGRGLVGIHGAGEAGSVLGHVLRLQTPAERAVITCRFSVPIECPCCKSPAPSEDYLLGVDALVLHVDEALAGTAQNMQLRRLLVRRYFGSKVLMQQAAQLAGVHRDTANNHYRKIQPVLAKLEKRAMKALEEACGRMIIDSEAASG